MADATKFTEDELKSLQELQGTYNQITMAMGQLSLSRLGLDSQEEQLKTTLADTRTKENELATEKTVDKVNYVEESSSEEYLRIEKLSVAPVLYLNKLLFLIICIGLF